ncbi:hypothetical protein DESACE_06335 [Desulfurella acetivorans A63]|nr:hypothetical protein DESACE_06335 [Desulfurella acetivorans A63]
MTCSLTIAKQTKIQIAIKKRKTFSRRWIIKWI